MKNSEELKAIHSELSNLRDRIEQIYKKDKLWTGHLEYLSGGITTLMVALYHPLEEIEKHEKRWGIKFYTNYDGVHSFNGMSYVRFLIPRSNQWGTKYEDGTIIYTDRDYSKFVGSLYLEISDPWPQFENPSK